MNAIPSKLEGLNNCYLNKLYQHIKDPQIEADLNQLVSMIQSFSKFKGKLITKLGQALDAKCQIHGLNNKLVYFTMLVSDLNKGSDEARKLDLCVNDTITKLEASYMSFFDREVFDLSEDSYQNLLKTDKTVAYYQPMLDAIRAKGQYLLAEADEQNVTVKNIVSRLKWVSAFRKSSYDWDVETDAFNALAGHKLEEDALRGYATPMSARNLSSKVDDAVVESLHNTVRAHASKICDRYGELFQKLSHNESFREVRFFIKDTDWVKNKNVVVDAYDHFSPTLAAKVRQVLENGYVAVGGVSGAYCATAVLSHSQVHSYVLLDYSNFKVFAHEIGHALHAHLAASKQGPLMWSAASIYQETASLFSEQLVFNHQLCHACDDQERLKLLLQQIKSFQHTVIRQIRNSTFEQKVYERRKLGELKERDFNILWHETFQEFYKEDAKMFWHKSAHYITQDPFHSYSYGFGGLFAAALFEVKEQMGEAFEPLYLNFLSKGDTEGFLDLAKPFGLNPNHPAFWENCIKNSFYKWLDEAEVLAKKLGYI